MHRHLYALILLTLSVCASASDVYFGFDQNTSGVVPLLDRPNHDAAKAAFVAAAGVVGTYDFEDAGLGGLNGAKNFGGVANGTFQSFTGTGITFAGVHDQLTYDCYSFSGSKYFMTQVDRGQTSFMLTFDHPLKAIGFSISDEADWFGLQNNPGHVLRVNNGETFSLTNGMDTSLIRSGSASFLGIVSVHSFTSIRFSYPGNGVGAGVDADAVGIDDIIVAVVPEPATLTVIGTALVGTLVRRRRSVTRASGP